MPHVETKITLLIDDQAVYSPQIIVDLSGNKLTAYLPRIRSVGKVNLSKIAPFFFV